MKNILKLFLLLLAVGWANSAFAQIQTRTSQIQAFSARQRVKSDSLSLKTISEANLRNIPININAADNSYKTLQYFINGNPIYYTTNNSISAKTISTNKVHTNGGAGLNLSGVNKVLGIWDAGSIGHNIHPNLTNKNVGGQSGLTITHNHSMHVAGTMVGTGDGNASAKGMAYGAKLFSYDYNDDVTEMANFALYSPNISNHSYSYNVGWALNGQGLWEYYDVFSSTKEPIYFGFYSDQSQAYDQLANLAPYYTIVCSAGNTKGKSDGGNGSVHETNGGADGFDCLPHGLQTAKNTITVGNINDIPNGYSIPSNVVLNASSSVGPTDDGRIKPDIVANGEGLISSVMNNITPAYSSYTGTSQAAPSVSGSLALLLEHQTNLNGNIGLLSSSLKGLVIHTADEAGTNPGPDYSFGWGLMNTEKAAKLMSNSKNACVKSIQEYVLNQGQKISFLIKKKSASSLKATICWTDLEGQPGSYTLNSRNRMLVNDLDLRLTSSQTYFPWKLDPNNPSLAATTGDNIIDNVEQVLINGAGTDVYLLTVTHKGILTEGSQAFSLILSGHEDIVSTSLSISNLNITNTQLYQATNDIAFQNVSTSIDANIYAIAGNQIIFNPGTNFIAGSKLLAEIKNNCNAGTSHQFRLSNNSEVTQIIESELASSNQLVFPNPISEGKLNFGKIAKTYSIYNSQGLLISEGSNVDGICVDNLVKGIYMIKVDSITSKFSKE